jgi:hypothetical protein
MIFNQRGPDFQALYKAICAHPLTIRKGFHLTAVKSAIPADDYGFKKSRKNLPFGTYKHTKASG